MYQVWVVPKHEYKIVEVNHNLTSLIKYVKSFNSNLLISYWIHRPYKKLSTLIHGDVSNLPVPVEVQILYAIPPQASPGVCRRRLGDLEVSNIFCYRDLPWSVCKRVRRNIVIESRNQKRIFIYWAGKKTLAQLLTFSFTLEYLMLALILQLG